MTITVTNEMDFEDIRMSVWAGAVDTVNRIYQEDKEDEFMDYLNMVFDGCDPTMTDINDFLWFEDDVIFRDLGITDDEDENDEE